MLVTFGRAATQELRERVRERLVSAERGAAPTRPRRGAGPTTCSRCSPTATTTRSRRRRARLARALADFDAATIATTHEFCQQMLAGLGMAGDVDPDATFVETIDDLVAEVVDDLYLRKYARPAAADPRSAAPRRSTSARARGRRPPGPARAGRRRRPTARPRSRYRFAAAVAGRGRARASGDRRLLDYDDLLDPLRDALADPVPARPPASGCARATGSCWSTSSRTPTRCSGRSCGRPSTAHATLVLIGDPKQAIYAFRGADVVTYLRRRRGRRRHATLGRNWRSDAALLRGARRGCSAAPRSATRGSSSARSTPRTRGRRLRGAPVDAPLRLRVVTARGARPRRGRPDRRSARPAALVAPTSPPTSSGCCSRAPGAAPRRRPVRPGDIAVLVRTNGRRALVRDALAAVGVPAVCPAAPACSPPRAPRTGWRCWRRWSSRAAPAGSAAAALTVLRRRIGDDARRAGPPSCSTSSAHRLRSWARRAGRAAASRPLLEAVDRRVRADRAAAGADRRRARAHRPAPRRPGAARGRRRRAARPGRAASSGCGTGSPRRPRTAARSAAGASSPTPPPCRSSPCTAARAWSSRSSTCRSAGTATSATRTSLLLHDDGGRPACSTSAADRAHGLRRRAGRGTAPRRPARTCGCSTSR